MVALLTVLLALVVIIGVGYEVTSRGRRIDASALLAIRDREIAQIMEATDEGFLSFDAVGTITSWSANSQQIFGWSAADVVGRKMTETLIPYCTARPTRTLSPATDREPTRRSWTVASRRPRFTVTVARFPSR